MAGDGTTPVVRTKVISHKEDPLLPLWLSREASNGSRFDASNSKEGVFEGMPGKSALKSAVLNLLGEAKEVALLSSFLFADPELESGIMDAARKGVRVYLLTASENRLKSERGQDSEQEMDKFEEHSALLRRLEGRILVRTGEDLHAKFIVTDPMSSVPRAILSTANFTTKAIGGNPEIGISLSGDQARDLARLFIYGFWHQAQHELMPAGRLLDVAANSVSHSYPRSLPYTASGSATLQKTLSMVFKEMEGEAWLSCYGFDKKHPIIRDILEALQRGVKMHVMSRPRAGGESAVKHTDALIDLVKAGAEVRAHPDLHAKALIWNHGKDTHGLVMTANLTSLGLDQGFEVGAVVNGERALALKELLQSWWSWMPYELRVDARVGNVKGKIRIWRPPVLQDAMVIKQAPEMYLGRLEARSQEEASSIQPSEFPSPKSNGQPIYYEEIPYRWEVSIKPGSDRTSKKGK